MVLYKLQIHKISDIEDQKYDPDRSSLQEIVLKRFEIPSEDIALFLTHHLLCNGGKCGDGCTYGKYRNAAYHKEDIQDEEIC